MVHATRRFIGVHALLALIALSLLPIPAPADPPSWAPANGWRRHQEERGDRDHERDRDRDYERDRDEGYAGYQGSRWVSDYGVREGTCNTAALGAVVGGVAGGVVGSQFGQGNGRTVATILGAAIGAVIGSNIGREMDATDRACMGQALELGAPNQVVVWTNPQTGVSYRMTPTRSFSRDGMPCRDFTERVSGGDRRHTINGYACRRGDGEWDFHS